MFIERVTEEQREYAEQLVTNYDFGQRGRGDGNRAEQMTGMIGQTVFADLLGVDRPDGEEGFDGGVDFRINNKRVDVKTMTRTTNMRDYYVHNFVGYQEGYDVDYYVFLSYNKNTKELTICGCISKTAFFDHAEFFPMNSWRERSDGTRFKTKAPLYEIAQSALTQVSNWDDLISKIQ